MLRQDTFLRFVLRLDCATCVATGLFLTIASKPIATLTSIPSALSFFAGLSLFPIAAFIGLVSIRQVPSPALVWLVIAGNAVWALGSLLLIVGGGIAPNALGFAFVLAQAAAVAVLAELELLGLRRLPAPRDEASVAA